MDSRIILISIKPAYNELIFNGTKTVELRKTKINAEFPKRVIVYSSSPQMAIVGEITFEKFESHTPQETWDKYSKMACSSSDGFYEYYKGKPLAYSYFISSAQKYKDTIPLKNLRKIQPGFQPPQNYFFLDNTNPLVALCDKMKLEK